MKYIVTARVNIIQIDEWEISSDNEELALENYQDGDLINSYPEEVELITLEIKALEAKEV